MFSALLFSPFYHIHILDVLSSIFFSILPYLYSWCSQFYFLFHFTISIFLKFSALLSSQSNHICILDVLSSTFFSILPYPYYWSSQLYFLLHFTISIFLLFSAQLSSPSYHIHILEVLLKSYDPIKNTKVFNLIVIIIIVKLDLIPVPTIVIVEFCRSNFLAQYKSLCFLAVIY